MKNVIFDKKGNPSLIIKNNYLISCDRNIYAGCIQEDRIYDFNGQQRAWLEEGFLIDLNGQVVGFMEQSLKSDKIHLNLPSIKNLDKNVSPDSPPPLEPALFLAQNIKDKITLSPNIKWADTNPSALMTVP